MKFLHAADLHLDSPLRGLERYEGAPTERIRHATRAAMENLVALCMDEQVDFLLLAGDLYDGDWPDYATGLFFSRQMSRLREAGIPVYLIRGNHDAANRMTKSLTLPDNVTELSTRKPQTVVDDRLGLAVHGQGFARREVTDDLAAGYPPPVAGMLNVGLLHTCLDGTRGHDPYAPCKLSTLVDRGYDYWALGHVHAREEVHRDPWVVFPGNLQGRHARETGAKGATLVTATPGKVTTVEHRTLDVVRWTRLEVGCEDAASPDDVVERVREATERAVDEADGRLVAARVEVTGATEVHQALVEDPERWESQIRAAAIDVAPDAAWVEKIRLGTRARIDLDELRERDDALGQLAASLRSMREDDDALSALAGQLEELARRLPRELGDGPDAFRVDDPEYVRELLPEIEQTLLPLLLSRGERP